MSRPHFDIKMRVYCLMVHTPYKDNGYIISKFNETQVNTKDEAARLAMHATRKNRKCKIYLTKQSGKLAGKPFRWQYQRGEWIVVQNWEPDADQLSMFDRADNDNVGIGD